MEQSYAPELDFSRRYLWLATSIESEINLTDLERGVEFDFRVTAMNAAGASIPSNIVTVVL